MGWFAPLWNVVWRVAIAVGILWFLSRILGVVAMFLVSGAFAYFVWLGVGFLIRLNWGPFNHWGGKVKRVIACILCYILLILFLWFVGVQISKPVKQGFATLKDNWSSYSARFAEYTADATDFYEKNVPEPIRSFLGDWRLHFFDERASVPGQAPRSPFAWISTVVELVLVPVLAFFFIVDGRSIKKEVLELIPRNRVRKALKISQETNQVMIAYTKSQVILCVLAGLVTYGIFLLRPEWRPYAAVVGIYAGLTRAIPLVGPIIGGIPIILLAGVSSGSPVVAAWVTGGFTAMHFLESKAVFPLIVGHRVEMHAVLVITSLLVAYEFFGIFGMFFGPPVAAIARNVIVGSIRKRRSVEARVTPELMRAG